MDKHLTKSFQIPSSPMRVFATTSRFTTNALYYRILVLAARKFSWLQHGINFLKKTGIGFVMSLSPLFCLMGIADAFMSIGQLEFFYDQAPESIRSISMA
uniref:Uncharacterized protein n=1 Tax=Populus trichocarpa TaxID=3694 RepID=A0A2K1YT46_POPTR